MVLDLISEMSTSQSSHVTLTISGFLSQNTNKKEHWHGVTKYFRGHSQSQVFDQNTAVYSLTWESYTQDDLYKTIAKSVMAAALTGVVGALSGPQSSVGIAILAAQCGLKLAEMNELFIKAKSQAKMAGKLLACILALRQPFRFQTVSLITFSLGSQVVKSCLKTLSKIYQGF